MFQMVVQHGCVLFFIESFPKQTKRRGMKFHYPFSVRRTIVAVLLGCFSVAVAWQFQLDRVLVTAARAEGLLEWAESGEGRCLRLTRRGRLLGNRVFVRFVS